MDENTFSDKAVLFEPRTAHWYFQKRPLGYRPKGSQGDSLYVAENPPFGAVFTYYLADSFKTQKQSRHAAEKKSKQAGKSVTFPGWDAVTDETREAKPKVELVVSDEEGTVLRRVAASNSKGINRVAWDLRRSYLGPVQTGKNWRGDSPTGFMVVPGTYEAELVVTQGGQQRSLAEPVTFNVEQLREGSLKGASLAQMEAFNNELSALYGQSQAARYAIKAARKQLADLETMVSRMRAPVPDVHAKLTAMTTVLHEIEETVFGNSVQDDIGGYAPTSVSTWLGHALRGVSNSSYGPTPSHRQSVAYAREAFAPAKDRLNALVEKEIPALRATLRQAGAPWTIGEPIAP
jgi:hypothetical protein